MELAAAVLASARLRCSLEVFGEVPLRADALTELDLGGKSLGPAEAIVLAEVLKARPVSDVLNTVFQPAWSYRRVRDSWSVCGPQGASRAVNADAVLTSLK